MTDSQRDPGPESPADNTTVVVDFEPVGRRGPCARGLTLLECARHLGVELSAVCGGNGTCGQCRVVLARGALSAPTSAEKTLLSKPDLSGGLRLACQAVPSSDCVIHVPPESLTATQRTQVEGLAEISSTDPPVTAVTVTVDAPSMTDVAGDADRVLAKVRESTTCERIDLEAARALPGLLRDNEYTVQLVVRGGEAVAVGAAASPVLGLAVDLGTTKVAGYLLDMKSGRTLAATGIMNPQIRFGEDVVTRMSHALQSDTGARDLPDTIVAALNQMAQDLAGEAGVDVSNIAEAVIGGNTAMHHLLLGLPVSQLARAPYVPALSDSVDVKARDLGLDIAPGAYVHVLPNVAGFVGGDHVAMLLAIKMRDMTDPVLAIDIGTNTEVCLIAKGKLTSVSCASGPAFEGGHMRDGMRAADGAIERVEVRDGEVHIQVIGDTPPVGICGSGILDALGVLTVQGIADRMGRLDAEHPLVKSDGKAREFVIVPEEKRRNGRPLGLTQSDIRQLQLAKAAIATGIQVLLADAGLSPEELSSVIVAGAFGTYIDLDSAIAVGMVPRLPLDRFRQVGNAAGSGAKLALASIAHRDEARRLATSIGYIELASDPKFMTRFVANTYLQQFEQTGG